MGVIAPAGRLQTPVMPTNPERGQPVVFGFNRAVRRLLALSTALAALSCCEQSLVGSSRAVGETALVVEISFPPGQRTVVPDCDMEIVSYDVTATGDRTVRRTVDASASTLRIEQVNPSYSWYIEVEARNSEGTVIGDDGTLYVGCADHRLYALSTGSGGLAHSPWPAFGGGTRRNGRVQ